MCSRVDDLSRHTFNRRRTRFVEDLQCDPPTGCVVAVIGDVDNDRTSHRMDVDGHLPVLSRVIVLDDVQGVSSSRGRRDIVGAVSCYRRTVQIDFLHALHIPAQRRVITYIDISIVSTEVNGCYAGKRRSRRIRKRRRSRCVRRRRNKGIRRERCRRFRCDNDDLDGNERPKELTGGVFQSPATGVSSGRGGCIHRDLDVGGSTRRGV